MTMLRRVRDVLAAAGERRHRYWYRVVRPLERAQALRARKRVSHYVGVTGSCGKTTAVRLLVAALQPHGRVIASRGDNIERSVYRTLRKTRGQVDFLVQEFSAHGGPGRLAPLATQVGLDVALVTTVGRDHWTAFENEQAIAAEKSGLLAGLGPDGVACLNADDPLVRAMAGNVAGRVITYGIAPDADLRAEQIDARWPGRLSFDLVFGAGRWRVETRFVGTLLLTSLLGAFAVIAALGLDMEAAVAAMGRAEPVFNHSSVHDGQNGHTFLLDTFKAPLWSTEKLLDDLANIGAPRTILVLGNIADIGSRNSQKMRRLLTQALDKADLVIATGRLAPQAARLLQAGPNPRLVVAASLQAAADRIAAEPPSLVVLKGSRTARLIRLWLMQSQTVTCAIEACKLMRTCQGCPKLDAPQRVAGGAQTGERA